MLSRLLRTLIASITVQMKEFGILTAPLGFIEDILFQIPESLDRVKGLLGAILHGDYDLLPVDKPTWLTLRRTRDCHFAESCSDFLTGLSLVVGGDGNERLRPYDGSDMHGLSGPGSL
ncbi:hypothetical protein E8E14_006279 [Neopestalotiopsis sp. 37M]|nr:hypothetical protein E8E14_006279 [Neopestalotiopsis sp. 37M]